MCIRDRRNLAHDKSTNPLDGTFCEGWDSSMIPTSGTARQHTYTHSLPYVLLAPKILSSVHFVGPTRMGPSLRTYHTGVPTPSFVFPWIEPGHCKNMQNLSAVLLAHTPPSCWSKEVAQ